MTDRLLLYIREFWRFAGDRIVNWLVLILFLLVLVIATRGYSNTLSSTMRKIRRLLPRLNALAKRRDGKVRHKDIRRAYSSSLMIQRLINAYTYDHRFDIKTRDAQSSVNSAVKMLESLSSPAYRSGDANNAFLLHSTGHKPGGTEIDASIIYADYYYIEALLRLKRLNEGHQLYD